MAMQASISVQEIQNCIFTVNGQQVMLDSDLAQLYGVETKVLNQAVKRNIERFPAHFRFEISMESLKNLRSQFVTSSFGYHGGRRYQPYLFTEQGVAMLAAVLKSDIAVQVSIQIIEAFVEMRKYLISHAAIFQRLQWVEKKQLEADQHFEQLFKALEAGYPVQKQGIFYDGQVFDARVFVSQLVRSAKSSLVLLDNYVDENALHLCSKKGKGVSLTIYSRQFQPAFLADAALFNAQYGGLTCEKLATLHDRFLIIDGQQLYHFGASLKDLGKKWFAFSRMDVFTESLLQQLHGVK
jgi:phage regulator Rha-like protein